MFARVMLEETCLGTRKNSSPLHTLRALVDYRQGLMLASTSPA